MKVVKMTADRLMDVRAFFVKYRYEHDESYLYEEDVEAFIGDDQEDPTWLLLKEHEIKGVLSFMLMDYFVKGDKTRIRLFYCEPGYEAGYKALWQAATQQKWQLSHAELFIPDEKKEVRKTLESLGFSYYRTAYVLIRPDKPTPPIPLPKDYDFRDFDLSQDIEHYRQIRNQAFEHLEGSQVPMTEEMVKKTVTESYQLDRGVIFLTYEKKPVGLIRLVLEEDEGVDYTFIAPLCLVPEHQGKGLGKALLYKGIERGREQGIKQAMLAVNGENDSALKLYQRVGFETDMVIHGYRYSLNKRPEPSF